ncbi:DUF2970 domain-containing protein [Chitinimonas naiadis]
MSEPVSKPPGLFAGVKTVLFAFTGIRRAADHESAVQGLTFKHFIVAGVLCALLLIVCLVSLVRLIAS